MFIVQNRETGLYWRNTTGRGHWRAGSDWVSDLQDVKPFRNMAAVRNVFMSTGSVIYNFHRARRENKLQHACCSYLKWTPRRGATNKCEHYKAAVEARKQQARDKYRVFKVELIRKAEQEL